MTNKWKLGRWNQEYFWRKFIFMSYINRSTAIESPSLTSHSSYIVMTLLESKSTNMSKSCYFLLKCMHTLWIVSMSDYKTICTVTVHSMYQQDFIEHTTRWNTANTAKQWNCWRWWYLLVHFFTSLWLCLLKVCKKIAMHWRKAVGEYLVPNPIH